MADKSLSILVRTLSYPWALLEVRMWANFRIFVESISPLLSLLIFSNVWVDGRLLLFEIDCHCSPKKSLKMFAFSLKVATSLILNVFITVLVLKGKTGIIYYWWSFWLLSSLFWWRIRAVAFISKTLIVTVFRATNDFR